MTKFFGRHHGRRRTDHHTDKESGLSDKTNFPLLSSKWMRGRADASTTDHSANFSARRLFSVSDRSLTQSSSSAPSPSELIKPDPKAVSPTQDVASTWMQMGSDESSKGAFPSVPSSARANTRDRATNNTNQKQSRQSSSKTTTTSTASSRGSSIQRSSRYASHNNSRSTMRKPRQQAHPVSNGAKASEWRSALDPKSGRTYFYNVRTRETQWRKPMELASPEERKEMEEKERKQKDFFAAMEANILSQMAAGVVPGTPKVSPNTTTTDVEMKEPPTRPKKPMLEKPRMVRTISGMDDQILKELVKRVPSLRNTSSSMKMSRDNSLSMEELGKMHDEGHLSNISEESMNMSAMEISLADLNYDMDVDGDSPSAREEHHALMQLAKTAEQMAMSSGSSANISPVEPPKPNGGKAKLPSGALKRPSLLDSRRNTCGTMYVGSTMSAPDKDATIKCVCGVYRAHIMSSAKDQALSSLSFYAPDAKYRIFNDREQDRRPSSTVREDAVMEDVSAQDIAKSVPSLDEITNFYRDVFRRAQMESDCIIMTLIYVERLIKNTDGGLRPRPSNWRSLLFSCMILSSKVWDDLSMWNADFSQTCPSNVKFSLQRINELELAVLNALDYKVKVPASEYAKYYFLLRSMLIKSGLGGDDLSSGTPLDIEGAKKLEQVSSSFQSTAATKGRVAKLDKLRSKSLGDVEVSKMLEGEQKTQEKKASLEHMVKM